MMSRTATNITMTTTTTLATPLTTTTTTTSGATTTTNGSSSYVKLSPPDYMYAYVTLCNVVMFVIGVLGNAMVIHVIVRMRALRSRVNYFLGSLAVADLLVLMVCQPSAMLAFYTRDRWILGYFICKTIPFLEHWTLHASVLTLLVIGFERFFTICTPLAEKSSICSSNAFILIVPVWVIASLLAFPFVFITHLDEATYYDNSKVMICHIQVSTPMARTFIVTSIVLMFLIPLLLLIFLYSSVIFTLRKLSTATSVAVDDSVTTSGGANAASAGTAATSCGGDVINSTTTSHRRHQIHPTAAKIGRHRRQVSRMMVAIVVLFFVSLLPFKILSLFLVFTSEKTLEDLGFESYHNLLNVARLMTYINSAGNPIIYGWMSPRFRRAFHLSTPKCRCNKDNPTKRGSFVYRYQQPKHDGPLAAI